MDTVLYRKGTKQVIWGIPVDFVIVDSEEVKSMTTKKGGWCLSPYDTLPKSKQPDEVESVETEEDDGDIEG